MPKAAKKRFANFWGGVGYVFVAGQWLFAALLLVPAFLKSEAYRSFVPQPASDVTKTAPPPTSLGDNSVLLYVGIIVAVIVIILSILLIIKIPRSVARTGKTVTTKSAAAIIPILTKQKPVKPAQKHRLTGQVIKYLKLMLVILPLVPAALSSYLPNQPGTTSTVVFIANTLAIVSLLSFSLQYILARSFKLRYRDVI